MERREFFKNSAFGLGGLAVASAMASEAMAKGGESIQTSALDTIRQWEPVWAEKYIKISTNPWENGVLDLKTIELLCVGISASGTTLQADSLRRHIRAALKAGATRDEIMLVIKGGAFIGVHSCSLGAPILLEEAAAAKVTPAVKKAATPFCDKLKETGQWNTAWDPFFQLDPLWTDQLFEAVFDLFTGKVLPQKFVELLSIACDASVTHMYAPGTRRHIKAALAAGATVEEIMETLKVAATFTEEASINLGVPILAEELAALEKKS